MTTQTETRAYHAVRLGSLWGSLATGAVIWSLHLVVSYALVSLACERGLLQATWGGLTLARWVTIGLTVLAAFAVLFAGVVAHRNWRQLRRTRTTNGDEPGGRFRFMALMGVLLNGIFLLAIVVSFFPIIFLPLCE